jgi:hypothetical protein
MATCSEAGFECTDDPCCDDSVCIVGGAVGDTPVCAARCADHEYCVSYCCALLTDSLTAVCQPPSACDVGADCLVILVGDDGEFLGEATSNTLATDGVCNEFSSYGSEFSSTSIYNPYGSYGSAYNSLGAYNEYTSTPPFVYDECSGTIIAFVTVNEFLVTTTELVHPDLLCAWLDAEGL